MKIYLYILMLKRIIVFGSIIIILAGLIVLSRLLSKDEAVSVFSESKKGLFEVSVSCSGELLAENSVQIWGPGYGKESNDRNDYRGGRGDSHGGDEGRRTTIRQEEVNIMDIVPEGTIVKKGDYVAQLDRGSYDNTLKDAVDNLETLQADMRLQILDTAITLNSLRDDIKNQVFAVEEAGIALEQAKFEPPAVIRREENSLNEAQRLLEQKKFKYELRVAQNLSETRNKELAIEQQENYIKELQDFIAGLTITAPAPGIVIYEKDRSGTKRVPGTMIDPFDEVIANLPDLASMLSKVYVNEIEISKVKPGQKVYITIAAFPGKKFLGTVYKIANVGEKLANSDSKMFEVMVKLDQPDMSFRPGMTTDNKIITKSFKDVVYVPLDCVHSGTDSITYVYKKNNTKQIVVIGESNNDNIIIEQGLEPGTMIYNVTPPDYEKFKTEGEDLVPIIKKQKQY